MQLSFHKYHGTGNDFILVDNRNGEYSALTTEQVALLCHRRFGIGADGLMLLQNKEGYDFEMVYFNADGRIGTMCGNGGRCIVSFAHKLGVISDKAFFLATDGDHHATVNAEGNYVCLQIIDVHQVNRDGDAWVINTGSPHYIQIVKGLANKNVFADGHAIRNNDTYRQNGINVNFVEPIGNGYAVRTFERGVEDETYACGTGVTAVAMAMALNEGKTGEVSTPIKVLGGDLNIRFTTDGRSFTNAWLEGPAALVFEGVVSV